MLRRIWIGFGLVVALGWVAPAPVRAQGNGNGGGVQQQIASLQTQVNQLIAALNAETARAEAAEAALASNANLNNEVARAKAAEAQLQSNIANVGAGFATQVALDAETAARKQGDADTLNAAQQNLTAEIARAKGAESTLTADLNSEIAARKQGDADTLASAKAYADGVTPAALTNEIARAEAAESTLTTSLNNEVSRAKAAEAALTNGVAGEVAARKQGDADTLASAKSYADAVTLNLDGEITRAKAAEAALTTSLNNETAARIAGDQNGGGSVPASLLALAPYVTVNLSTINGLVGPHIIFEGANVHIRNASGATYDYPDGLGNLIVGYNDGLYVGLNNHQIVPSDRAGSHNLIVGDGHLYPASGGFVGGFSNKVLADKATVSAGQNNLASGPGAGVSGGWRNSATGQFASVSGGENNTASGQSASVSGGQFNQALDSVASVSGGSFNKASGSQASVSGGENNEAAGWSASIAGGKGQVVSANINDGFAPTVAADATTLAQAEAYTDAQLLGEAFARGQGDTFTLAQAKSYADQKVAGLGQGGVPQVLLDLAPYLDFQEGVMGGVVGPHIVFHHLNVHVQNRLLTANNSYQPDGLGNLIVGVNIGDETLFPLRTGSNNLIIGDNHAFTGSGGLVAGFHNAITADKASVTGGHDNKASGIFASVTGGDNNEAGGNSAAVAGGEQNIVNTNSGFAPTVAADATTLAQAKQYTDAQVAAGDAATLAAANQHTDTAVAAEAQARIAGDLANNNGGVPASLLALAPYVYVDPGTINGLVGPHVIFHDANVHVRNGNAETYSNANGLGNLVVGYNENVDFFGALINSNRRSGSHNLIVGGGHVYTASGGFAAGMQNFVSAQASAVSGGAGNTASGLAASVSGGLNNFSTDQASTVSGGFANTASAAQSSVSGGNQNTASTFAASVSGGFKNTASGNNSSVSGGEHNTASGDMASVSGGAFLVAGIADSWKAGTFHTP